MKENQIAGLLILMCLLFILKVRAAEISVTIDNWKEFHVHHCGLVCQNGSRVRLYAEKDCERPACFPCDCEPTCSKLDTCCPEGAVQPDGSVILFKDKREQPNIMPPYKEQIQCGVVAYVKYRRFVQVASCPSLSRTLNTSTAVTLETRKLCEEMNDNSAADFFGPFVDVHTGLVFRNKFCALCNGYSLRTADATPEPKTVLSASHKDKMAAPWAVKVNCLHYQFMFAAKSQKQLLDMALIPTYGCEILNAKALSERQPTQCFRTRPELEDYENLKCGTVLMNLCHNLNSVSLGVSGAKNIFCFICRGYHPIHRKTKTRGVCYVLGGFSKNPFVYPPITLLLGLSAQKTAYNTEERNKCSSESQWVDVHAWAASVQSLRSCCAWCSN
ncbi:hypothetical protein ElyMa_000006500 [Elysia marginata]|uniref:SMB domain-containing protein n=1 Tax=Elysia marginata TaxID=1093978 RepID=A0AAV4E9G5_9GAST|nr:hypothetical protein ElyMa_000006500 [Elysia marginata]